MEFSDGSVDFSPERQVAPGDGADAFPPSVAEPGSRGSDDYSPLVKVTNTNTVYDAPIVSMASDEEIQEMSKTGNIDYSKVHDKVVAINYAERTVTLALTTGYSFARPVLYLSTDANDPAVAALEGATPSHLACRTSRSAATTAPPTVTSCKPGRKSRPPTRRPRGRWRLCSDRGRDARTSTPWSKRRSSVRSA